MTSGQRLSHMVCLGCGCACDDIEIHVDDRGIVEAGNACERGAAWYGDGRVPARVLAGGVETDVAGGIAAAADRLARAAHPLVYLAPDVTCEAQRAAVALADPLRASLDSVTSAAGLRPLLAAQERGRTGATLGEIRNRADVLLFWGVDPSVRYPRFVSRYAPGPEGLQIESTPRDRTIVAIDVGESRGPDWADHRFPVAPADEVEALTAMTAVLQRGADAADAEAVAGRAPVVRAIVPLLAQARYVAVIVDGEPREGSVPADPQLPEAIIVLTQTLNGLTRAAAIVLRGGGNRSGADAVLTWQTGFPAAVDFTRGYPRYRPFDGAASPRPDRHHIDALVIVGAMSAIPDELALRLPLDSAIVIGPRATESRAAGRGVAIDTGVAGIHEGGLALRMDDVPLPLRAALEGPPATEAIVRALTGRIVTNRGL
jgi:formylmethanofuran dehydrogenase subunit B